MSKSSVGLMEQAHDYILSLMMTKQLTAGQRIPEVKIAEQFSISKRGADRDLPQPVCRGQAVYRAGNPRDRHAAGGV